MESRRKLIVGGVLVILVAIGLVVWRVRGAGGDNGGPASGSAERGSGGGNGDDTGRRGIAPTIAQRPGQRIAGIVVTEDGAPVRGATVRLASARTQAGSTTDDAGRFDLGTQSIDSYAVTAEHAGLTAAVKDLDLRDPTASADQLRLVLYPCAASIHGTIRDSGGGIVEGASVMRAVTRLGAGRGAISAKDGTYELCVPPGDSFVVVRADGYATVFDRASAFGKTRHDFTLAPGASLAGRVVQKGGGDPVEGALVSVTGDDRMRMALPSYAVSDAQGRFQVDGLMPGRQAISATGIGVATQHPCEAETEIGRVADVVCEVDTALTIAGKLVERGGGPLAGVTVRMLATSGGRTGAPAYDVTQRDGTFLIEHVFDGEYRPFVEDTDQQFGNVKVEKTDVTGVVLEVDKLGSIAGRVMHGGKPVAGASVQLQQSNRAETSDDTGAFVFKRVPAGTYQVYAESHRAGAFTKGPTITLGPNEQRTGVVLELDLSGSIEGVVIDQNGRPVPGVYLSFSLVGGRDFGMATTDDDGTFTARSLSGGGDYALDVRDRPGSGIAFQPVTGKRFPRFTVADGDTHLTGVKIQIRWERLSIAGRVTDGTGQPVPDVNIEALTENGRWMRAPSSTSDQNGAFAVRDLPAGTYSLRAEGPGGATTRADGITAGRTDVALKLAAPGGLDGTLVGFTDAVEILAYAADRGRQYRAVVTGTTFRIAQLPAGEYYIRAISKSGSAMENVEVEGGKRAAVTMTNLGVGVVTGTVRDAKTKAPLEGMTCWVEGQVPDRSLPPRTDANGAFRIEGAAGGTHPLSCYGQQRYATIQVTVPSGGAVAVELSARDPQNQDPTSDPGMTLEVVLDEVRVASVAPRRAAERAGIKVGDVITSVEKTKLEGRAQFIERALRRVPPGTKLSLGIERGDKELTVELTLDPPPSP